MPVIGSTLATAAAALPGEPVFDVEATASYDTFEWDFGDGNTATGAEVDHRYWDASTYWVVLTATDESNEGLVSYTLCTISDGTCDEPVSLPPRRPPRRRQPPRARRSAPRRGWGALPTRCKNAAPSSPSNARTCVLGLEYEYDSALRCRRRRRCWRCWRSRAARGCPAPASPGPATRRPWPHRLGLRERALGLGRPAAVHVTAGGRIPSLGFKRTSSSPVAGRHGALASVSIGASSAGESGEVVVSH